MTPTFLLASPLSLSSSVVFNSTGGWTSLTSLWPACVQNKKVGLPRQTHHRHLHNIHGSSYQAFLIYHWKRKMPRKCKTNPFIFMISSTWLVFDGSFHCCCVYVHVCCVHVFVLEIRSLICFNRYSLVTGGVSVLWLRTWFVLVESSVVHGWSSVQHACAGTHLCVPAVLWHTG